MRAMILAAGLGKRMRPLTDKVPKPLLKAGGKYLIEYHLERIAAAGIEELVINTHWLADQLPAALGNGDKWGLTISYSHEPELLETAGGIRKALPSLVDEQTPAFLLINGDVYTELDLASWLQSLPSLSQDRSAYLGLVPNPEHHLQGDFSVSEPPLLRAASEHTENYTYSGIAVFHRSFFDHLESGPSLLGPKLKEAASAGKLMGVVLEDYWLDVGTPERLDLLRERLTRVAN